LYPGVAGKKARAHCCTGAEVLGFCSLSHVCCPDHTAALKGIEKACDSWIGVRSSASASSISELNVVPLFGKVRCGHFPVPFSVPFAP
jgi:hypothetical protein